MTSIDLPPRRGEGGYEIVFASPIYKGEKIELEMVGFAMYVDLKTEIYFVYFYS